MYKNGLSGALAGLALLAAGVPAMAQERQEMVVVTGSRISSGGGAASNVPSIYLRLPADFVQFGMTCQSATRDTVERRAELEAQYETVLAWAEAMGGYEVTGGSAGEDMIPLDTISFRELLNSRYGGGETFNLILNVDVCEGETFDGLKLRVEEGRLPQDQGRAECFLQDDQFIGIRGLQEHRRTLLGMIAQEAEELKTVFGANRVNVRGLENQARSFISGSLSIDVYVPYDIDVSIGE